MPANAEAFGTVVSALGSLLPTLAVHATLLLGTAWVAERLWFRRQPARAELLWRGALLASLLSLLSPLLPDAPARIGEGAPAATTPASAGHLPAGASTASARTAAPPAGAGDTGPRARIAIDPTPTTAAGVVGHSSLRLTVPAAVLQAAGGAWLAGCIASLVLLALGMLRLRRQPRGVPAPASVQALGAQLARRLGVPSPQLRCDAALASALALPGRTILLPAWALALPPAQVRAMLAHELWHLRRGDPRWRVLHRLLLAPLFFHPLAWLARRRLDALAETACDAAAAQVAGSGRPLAHCLAACIAHLQRQPAGDLPRLASAMTHRPGAIVHRVRHLLEETPPMNAAVPSRWLRAGTLSLAIASALALPAVAVTAGGTMHRSVQVLVDDAGRQRVDMHVSGPDSELQVELDGKVRFTAAEDDVAALTDGGKLDISEEREGVLRRVLFEGMDGRVQRTAWIDGDAQPFDADTAAWLAALLPQVLRETGIDAEGRAHRLLEHGGADALLAEIALIPGDNVRGTYLAVLLAQPGLQPVQLERALELAAAMESDFELRRTLQRALATQALDAALQARLLELALEIGSDFERAELLRDAFPVAADATARSAWQAAVAGLGSDFERRRVLEDVLEAGADADALARVLQVANGFGSDFELRSLLQAALPHLRDDAALQDAWHAAARRLDSDFERRVALVSFLETVQPGRAASLAVLESAAGIGSDFETLQVLRALAAVMPADADLIARYRALARGLSSHSRGEAEQALDRFAVL